MKETWCVTYREKSVIKHVGKYYFYNTFRVENVCFFDRMKKLFVDSSQRIYGS